MDGHRLIHCGIDAIENLVLADRRCNNDKRDLLPGPPHVTAWARRNQRHGPALTSLATADPVISRAEHQVLALWTASPADDAAR